MIRFADPKEWWLELAPTARVEAIRQSQPCSTPASRHRAYLNALGLNAVLEWTRAEVPEASPWLSPTLLPTVWEVVNGTVIRLGAMRLVLMPTEEIDDGALEVPQEWVDSPNWAGDYYLAVQVKPESGWVRIWGYATHQELKSLGRYDSLDRTYALDAEHLTQDLNAFWATYQLCGAAQTRMAIAPLPELSPHQAEQLIQRLGDPAIAFPRLAVPFSLWAALLARDDWRQALYTRRCDREWVRPVRLHEWLQGQFTAVWQAVDAVLLPAQMATAWRSAESGAAISLEYRINRVKVLELGAHLAAGDTARIALLIGMTPISDTQVNLGLHIGPVGDQATFLQDVQVRLLAGDGTEVGRASATVTETIQFQFSGQVGERFSVEVTMGDQMLTEPFEI